jgi:hypothetical protein
MRLNILIAAIAALLVSCVFSAAQAPRPAIELVDADKPLALRTTPDSKVVILNNTTRALTVSISVADGSQEDPRLSSIIELQPTVLPLLASGSGAVSLKVKSSTGLKPGLISGYLVVSESSTDIVLRRRLEFRITVQETSPKAQLPPLVKSLTSTVYYNPLSAEKVGTFEAPLPLASAIKAADIDLIFKDDPTVAKLAADNGDTGLVRYRGAQENLPVGTTGLLLDFKSTAGPGTYNGEAPILQNAEGKPVTIKVVSKHHWWFPALVIAFGILVYYLMQRYLNVLRKIWGLQEQEAVIENSFLKADETFAAESKGKGYTRYSIKKDFDQQSKLLLSSIKEQRLKNFIKLNENTPEYKAIITSLGEMETTVRDWGAFTVTKLSPLQRDLEAARPSFNPVPTVLNLDKREKPEIAVAADKLLKGAPELTIAQFKTISTSIGDLRPRMTAFPELNSRAAKVLQGFETILKDPGFASKDLLQQAQIKTNRDATFSLWRTLWVDGTFDPKGVTGQLMVLENALALVQSVTVPAGPKAKFTVAREIAEAGEGEAPLERIESISRKRMGLDVLYIILALAVALFLGLGQFYFNSPFGTIRDYINAFVVGFSSKAMIDLVAAAIDRFGPTRVATP